MADGRRGPQFGAQEGGAEFGDEFLARIRFIAMATREVTVEPRDMACPVTQLVELGAGDVFGAATLGTLINVGVAATENPQLTVYGAGLDLGSSAPAVPVGPNCRLCVRRDCVYRSEDPIVGP